MEYYYREEEYKRNFKIGRDHISLALQGGGAKGVVYVGAYAALNELTRG